MEEDLAEIEKRAVSANIAGFDPEQIINIALDTTAGDFWPYTVLLISNFLVFIAVGSIIRKPGVVGNRIEIREYLYMTVSVDHDVIDGALAVRALSKLTKLVEQGFDLS